MSKHTPHPTQPQLPFDTSTRTCATCNKTMTLDAFVKRKNRKDGRGIRCKKCQNAKYKGRYAGRYADKYKGRYADKYKGRYVSRHKKKYPRRFTKRDKEVYAKWHAKNPLAKLAHTTVQYAVKKGKLPPVRTLQCSRCASMATHYHHHLGYEIEYHLDVIPICASCHRKRTLSD